MMVLESGACDSPVATLPPLHVALLTQIAGSSMSAVKPEVSCVLNFNENLDRCGKRSSSPSLSPWCVNGRYDNMLEQPDGSPGSCSINQAHPMETDAISTSSGNINFAIEIKQDIPVTETDLRSPVGEMACEIQSETKTRSGGGSSQQQPVAQGDQNPPREEKTEDDVVWICFVCAKGFSDQSELMSHQDACEEAEQEAPAHVSEPIPAPPPLQSYHDRLRSAHPTAATAVPTLLRKVGSDYKTLPLGLPRYQFRRKRRKWPEVYIPPSRETYFNVLGLGPKTKIEEISSMPRKGVDEDCGIIDLTDDDLQPSVPPTPRTPKSLMSQLSRDDASGRRRHLSFSQPPPVIVESKKNDGTSDSDCESSDSGEEEKAPRKNCAFRSMLSGIPLTSPLGQRLKKYWHTENQIPVVANFEQFCSTSQADFGDFGKTGSYEVMDKLRHRPPPPVTFKFTKKYMNKWFHSYKFNSADIREFWKRLETGLVKESRHLLRQQNPCKVVLSKLSAKDIRYWTTPRPRAVVQQQRYVPSVQTERNYNTMRLSASQQAQYLRNVMWQPSAQVRTSNVSFNRQPAMLSSSYPNLSQSLMAQDGIVVSQGHGPTPQLLLRTVTGGGQDGMRLEVVPILNQPTGRGVPASPHLAGSNRQAATGSQKRKQTFDNVRNDDEISIISLSSDEDAEPAPKSAKCCLGCNKSTRANCAVHGRPRIGPASFMRRRNSRLSGESIVAGSAALNRESTATTHRHWDTSKDTFLNLTPQTSTYTRMVNGKVIYPHAQQNVPVVTPSSDADGYYNNAHIPETVNKLAASQSRPDSAGSQDYMDYEVICIDSSDENE